MAGMRSLAWFLGIAGLHFVLSVAGTVLALRAAFDTQAGFWAAPGTATLAYLSEVLLSPLYLLRAILPAEWRGGYAEIATVSILFGALAVGIVHTNRGLRSRRDDAG